MPRSLDEWLAHQSALHPQAIDLGLERLQIVLERLRWRQPDAPVITVAGTNGKGSVTAYCTAILGAAGYRVGTFTSPHLRDYRERIRIQGRLATAEQLVQAFERIEAARLLPHEITLTFFEYNALAAFLIFEAAGASVWVLEVGMGGRLDAVNVVDSTVAILVSVALDHQEFLGSTLEEIAREKAGVFRRGRLAVFGCRELPPGLLDTTRSLGATAKRIGIDFDYQRVALGWQYRGSRWKLPVLPLPALWGEAQLGNAATALAALEELSLPTALTPTSIARGLESVQLSGRFQIIAARAASPAWVLDVAHNPHAAQVLASNLRELPCAGKSLAVCGILADKDAVGIAAALRGSFDAWWVAATDSPRGTSAGLLAERIAAQLAAPLTIAGDVGAACAAAFATAGPGDRIVVFGSFHTVGPALDWLEGQGLLPQSALLEYTHLPHGL